MKIIKEGTVKTIVFECDGCGCVFEADNTEYKEDWRTPKPECECCL